MFNSDLTEFLFIRKYTDFIIVMSKLIKLHFMTPLFIHYFDLFESLTDEIWDV